MTDTTSIGILLAMSAGLISFLSPCVLPLVPSYVSFITGMSLDDVERSPRAALVHSLLFVAGFTLIFLALGATATVIGQMMKGFEKWLSGAGGVLIVLFGLVLLGVIRIDALTREGRFHFADKPLGYLGTLFVGVAFGAGWTPCIGPILAGILTFTATEANLQRGLVLLGAYSLGLAVPFVLAAVALGRFFVVFTWIRRHLLLMNRIAGATLVAVGILMITGRFSILASWLVGFTPDWILERL